MSASVLFDAPGPKTILRHRIYTVVAGLALLAILALVVIRLEQKGQLAYRLWEPFITPVYDQVLLEGLLKTLQMAALSVVFSVVFGLVLGTAKLSEWGWVRWPAWAIVEFFRAVPVLLLMVFFFLTYGVGEDGIGPYWCVVAALTLYNGSVLAEVFRAGVNAVPRGQREAAYALGMRKSQVMVTILLPQALRTMLPAIVSQLVVLLKDTALGFLIVYDELLDQGKDLFDDFQFERPVIPVSIVIAVIYILMCSLLSLLAYLLDKRLRRSPKTADIAPAAEDEIGALGAQE